MAAYDFQSALDNLAGGALQTLWAIAFRTLVLTSFRWPSTSAVTRAGEQAGSKPPRPHDLIAATMTAPACFPVTDRALEP